MKGFHSKLAVAILGLLLTAAPALAQDARTRPASTPEGGDRAIPRSDSGGAVARDTPSRDTAPAPPSGGDSWRPADTTNNTNSNTNTDRDVTNWSRPRGDRPATDIAVTRTGPRPPRDSDERNHPKITYIPSTADIYVPVPYDVFYGVPFVYFDQWDSIPAPSTWNPKGRGEDQGSLKLKVKPRNTKVYVDGFYVGTVDEFDGAHQKLMLNGGRHRVELRAEGFETAVLDVLITPEKTLTFAGTMLKAR